MVTWPRKTRKESTEKRAAHPIFTHFFIFTNQSHSFILNFNENEKLNYWYLKLFFNKPALSIISPILPLLSIQNVDLILWLAEFLFWRISSIKKPSSRRFSHFDSALFNSAIPFFTCLFKAINLFKVISPNSLSSSLANPEERAVRAFWICVLGIL